MTRGKLRRELAQEMRDYLADVRAIIDSLRRVEGWIALGLMIAVMAMLAVWFFTSLGFSPPNDKTRSVLYMVGMYSCRPVSNVGGVIILIDLALLLILSLLALGNLFAMLERIRQGRPRELRDLVITATLMLAIGIGGIIYMRMIC